MRSRWRLQCSLLTLGLTLGVSTAAFADQCSYITKEQSLAAVARLNVGQTLYKLCEPCGETKPTPVQITNLSAGTTGSGDYWEVKVNEANIDLAYSFIPAGIKNQKVNLAAVVGCPAQDVSTVLR